jgi:hypothetical protein
MCRLANNSILELCVRILLQDPEVISPVNIEVEQVLSRLRSGGCNVAEIDGANYIQLHGREINVNPPSARANCCDAS